jgi:hypothetical protein
VWFLGGFLGVIHRRLSECGSHADFCVWFIGGFLSVVHRRFSEFGS